MSSTRLLRDQLAGVHLPNMCAARLDTLIEGIATMAERHNADITGLLAGGSESVVVSARTRSGAQLVVKGTTAERDAVLEAQMFASAIPTPRLYDLDTELGVLALERVTGGELRATPLVDPAGELAALSELLDAVRDANLDAATLPEFTETFQWRAERYNAYCAAAGRDDIAELASTILDTCTGTEWVPVDLHPKNILIGPGGEWLLIDPMPTRHHLNWCSSKWAIVRRNPGELAGAQLDTWVEATGGAGLEHLVGTAVWEVGSQRSEQLGTGLLGVVDDALRAAA